MKRKGYLALATVILTMTLSSGIAYAGGHHGGGHGCKSQNTAWHKETDNYKGHYSNQCEDYDHAWHKKTDDYYGHYSYACDEYGHGYNHEDCISGYHCGYQEDCPNSCRRTENIS